MLLKTHIEKMSIFPLSTIFMKTNELQFKLHDINENKRESSHARKGKRSLAPEGRSDLEISWPQKMLKMKDDPAMYMKTHGTSTECPTEKRT
jgi:hypothetical protein